MWEFLNTVCAFPTLLFSVALVVVAVFWLLVPCGAAAPRSFDSDVDTQALRPGPVPVSVAATVFTVAGWLLSLTGSVLLDRADPARSLSSLLSLAVLALAAVASWWVTRRLVPPLTKLFPDEPGPSGEDFGGLPGPLERHRSTVAGRHRATVRLRRRR